MIFDIGPNLTGVFGGAGFIAVMYIFAVFIVNMNRD